MSQLITHLILQYAEFKHVTLWANQAILPKILALQHINTAINLSSNFLEEIGNGSWSTYSTQRSLLCVLEASYCKWTSLSKDWLACWLKDMVIQAYLSSIEMSFNMCYGYFCSGTKTSLTSEVVTLCLMLIFCRFDMHQWILNGIAL